MIKSTCCGPPGPQANKKATMPASIAANLPIGDNLMFELYSNTAVLSRQGGVLIG